MSYENDVEILSEYAAWKLSKKYRDNDDSPAAFLIERTRDAAYDKLQEIDLAYEVILDEEGEDYLVSLENFVKKVGDILEKNS